ncbi:MAG TPA: helix-turn-helix domain-containing protein [Jiangellaceae bacterium]
MTKESKDKAASAGTRERILQAAIELIAEVGGDRLRTRAVAERAGVNQALVHYHFGSMAALLQAADEAVLAREGEPFFAALEGEVTVADLVEGLFAPVERIGEPTPELMVAIDMLVRATRDEASRNRSKEALAELRSLIHDRLAAARRRGEISEQIDPEAAAAVLGAVLDGLGMHRLIDPELDVRPAIHLITTMLTKRSDDADRT